MLELVEIQKVVSQGMTKPLLCKGSDGKTYYAKGKQATASGLIKEWIAANLAKELSLPLPNFHIAYIDNLLVESFGQEAVDCLGSGYVFVSERIESATDFKYHLLNEISPQLQKTILLFDLWIENEDRTLSKDYSGNPNLLWQSSSHQLYIIDHNLAFDSEFNLALFKETHVFQALFSEHQLDICEKIEFETLLLNSLKNWSQWWHKIPQEWQEQNEDTKLFCPQITLQRLKTEAQGDIWLKL
ncbi:MAG: HipA family kinase [Methylococcaceae bacterium]